MKNKINEFFKTLWLLLTIKQIQTYKEEREEQEQESVENIKEAITKNETPDVLSQKSKDLFDELFGDK